MNLIKRESRAKITPLATGTLYYTRSEIKVDKTM